MLLRIKLLIFLLFTSLTIYSQEVFYEDQVYVVEGTKILRSGVDITKMLSIEKRETIQRRANRSGNRKPKTSKIFSTSEPNTSKQNSEIQFNKSELTANDKKSSIAIKYDIANKQLKDAYSRYGFLKRQGDLSRSEEDRRLDEIEKIKAKIAKIEAKLD